MYMKSQQDYIVMLEFDGGISHRAGETITLEHFQEALRRVSNTDVSIKTLHHITTWTDRARQVTSYRNGRVFLAGDAAHIHSPLGGQGLNLGLGDALNLGWKLAAVIQNKAPEGLLESYQAERYPIGEQILDWSRAQVAIMRPGPHARALNAVVRDLISIRDGATYFAAKVWGIFTQYDLGESHPLTGYSVPNFEFTDGTKIGELMSDGTAILLDFNENNSLKTLAESYNIRYISAQAKHQLGLNTLLIRPDGIIAWASETTPDCDELPKALSRWFVYHQ